MKRLGYVDGLRALAVLGVVVYHAAPACKLPNPDFLNTFLKMGAHGVDLFFVISGFCLAYPFVDRMRTTGSYAFDARRFLAKRLVRIVPPYYAAIAILLGLAQFGIRFGPAAASSPWLVIQQLLFLERDLTFLEGAFWTLPIEFRWYFAFPFLLWLYAKSPRAFAAVGIASVVCYFFTRLNSVDIGTISAFMLGIWAADLQVKESPLRRFGLAVFVPCFVFSTFLEPDGQHAYYAVEPIGTIAFFALVVAAGAGGPLNSILSARPFRFIGVASYSIYLFNHPIILWLEETAHLPGLVAGVAGTILPIAFWWCVERPLTTSPLHERLVAAVENALRPAAAFAGIPGRQTVHAAPEPVPIIAKRSASA